MTHEEIDIMWQQAMQESIKDGDMFIRYHFAKLVADKEREKCAKMCAEDGVQAMDFTGGTFVGGYFSKKIIDRGET